jgi:Reverse transcriptase (RNA-dependent DNA polymerase).
MSQHIPAEIKDLLRQVLTTTYFLFDGTFYEQTNGVAMGSPLAPTVVKIYMKKFEQEVLSTAKKKPTHWYRNVDDTFWPHGKQTLQDFLQHLNTFPLVTN